MYIGCARSAQEDGVSVAHLSKKVLDSFEACDSEATLAMRIPTSARAHVQQNAVAARADSGRGISWRTGLCSFRTLGGRLAE